ncbi:MAG: response regulator [Piscinibacter sp.]|nr:response regulator [Piscinibacter sp.]
MARGRLLILDDDATVGQILLLGAQASGFEARLCLDVAAFFAALTPWAPTHLAIDLTLPGGSGVEVLRQVATLGCRARVIICSGAGAADLDAALAEVRALGLDGAGVLAKPFTLAQLRTLIATP